MIEFAKKLESQLGLHAQSSSKYQEIDSLAKKVYEKLKDISNQLKNNGNDTQGQYIASQIPYHRAAFWLKNTWGIQDLNNEYK